MRPPWLPSTSSLVSSRLLRGHRSAPEQRVSLPLNRGVYQTGAGSACAERGRQVRLHGGLDGPAHRGVDQRLQGAQPCSPAPRSLLVCSPIARSSGGRPARRPVSGGQPSGRMRHFSFPQKSGHYPWLPVKRSSPLPGLHSSSRDRRATSSPGSVFSPRTFSWLSRFSVAVSRNSRDVVHTLRRPIFAPRPSPVRRDQRSERRGRHPGRRRLTPCPTSSSLSSGGRRRSLLVFPYERGPRIPSETGNRIPEPLPAGLHHAVEGASTLSQGLSSRRNACSA
jgi:hypothetical protein